MNIRGDDRHFKQDDLVNYLMDQGASLVGFADLHTIQNAELPYGISIIMKLPVDIIYNIKDGPTQDYYDMYCSVNQQLDILANLCAEYIRENGYQAIAQTTDVVRFDTDFRTKMPHKTVAVNAGLGWIGKNALLLTKEYGSAIRLTSVLTDAPIHPSKPVISSSCGECSCCVDACPGKAISGKLWSIGMKREELYDAATCYKTARKIASEKIQKEITLCGKCIEVCPYTKRYLNKGNRMTTADIWKSFCNKLSNDSLCDDDFVNETRLFLSSLLSGPASKNRRNKFIQAPAEYYDMESKAIVILKCFDDDYRFDFIKRSNGYALSFVECVTLPISNINTLPYSDFNSLPQKETHIRNEKEISRTISFYLRFKELLGRDEAIKLFLDGAGENIAARSWVPFYTDRLAYIAYAAWIENRIHGEEMAITQFSDTECVLCFKNHIWRQMYQLTGHLKTQINYDEYIWIFEEIWRNRAQASGWTMEFSYDQDDTILTFKA